jgi:hypothetical protein
MPRVVGAGAGLHDDETRLLTEEEGQHLVASKLLAEDRRARDIR